MHRRYDGLSEIDGIETPKENKIDDKNKNRSNVLMVDTVVEDKDEE